jgi:hypothetical protein
MKRIESLADALALLNDYHDPESEAYRLRNPGMLRSKAILGIADETIRTFTCHQAGYKALTDSLRKQCERYKEKTLKDGLTHHGHGSEPDVKTAVDFIKRATGDKTIGANTKLGSFLDA